MGGYTEISLYGNRVTFVVRRRDQRAAREPELATCARPGCSPWFYRWRRLAHLLHLRKTCPPINADDVKWGPVPPNIPAGAQLAVISGDAAGVR